MAKPGEGARAISALLMKNDDLSVADIITHCGVDITASGVHAFMYALVKRGHATKTDSAPSRWSLTTDGRKAIDLVLTARQGLDAPAKTVDTIARRAIAEARLDAAERVPFPRSALRLLASAALASAKPLDPQLRFACELAIKEAA
jgi:predicted transcriptional regulator